VPLTTVENLLDREMVQNDASARPPNVTSASCERCDLYLWPSDPEIDRSIPCLMNHLCQYHFRVPRTTSADWQQIRFIRFQNIVFTIYVTVAWVIWLI